MRGQRCKCFYGTFDPIYNERRGGLAGRFYLAAQNGGEALDGLNKRKERHEAKLPDNWRQYEGQHISNFEQNRHRNNSNPYYVDLIVQYILK